jgi:hypothetical protein
MQHPDDLIDIYDGKCTILPIPCRIEPAIFNDSNRKLTPERAEKLKLLVQEAHNNNMVFEEAIRIFFIYTDFSKAPWITFVEEEKMLKSVLDKNKEKVADIQKEINVCEEYIACEQIPLEQRSHAETDRLLLGLQGLYHRNKEIINQEMAIHLTKQARLQERITQIQEKLSAKLTQAAPVNKPLERESLQKVANILGVPEANSEISNRSLLKLDFFTTRTLRQAQGER